MPERLGPLQTVYKRFAKWTSLASWDGLLNNVAKSHLFITAAHGRHMETFKIVFYLIPIIDHAATSLSNWS
ncbi:MAG: hypothetical protein HUN04_12430 [Desulfobacter sp.]|nr:MAG: hypothetical protein HUN04_12430 [Desulfobacter sp.]